MKLKAGSMVHITRVQVRAVCKKHCRTMLSFQHGTTVLLYNLALAARAPPPDPAGELMMLP